MAQIRVPGTPALQPCHKKDDLGVRLQYDENEILFLVRLPKTSEASIQLREEASPGCLGTGTDPTEPPRDTQIYSHILPQALKGF